MKNDTLYLCFRLKPGRYTGYPLPHLLAMELAGPDDGEQTLKCFFASDIITITGTGLADLQDALLTGRVQEHGDRVGSVTSVKRQHYGS